MSTVSRRQLVHPGLGTAGGSALYASIENLYTILGNDDAGRYNTFSNVANSTTMSYQHNFGVPLSELRVMLYTGTYPNFTPVTGWTVAATAGSTTTSIDITTPSSGGPFTGMYFILQDRQVSNVSNALQGQILTYDSASGLFINDYLKLTSEAATIVSNTLTPASGRTTQRITGTASDLYMIANQTTDQVRLLVNETGSDITVKNDTGAVTAARIYTGTGNDFTFKSQSSLLAFYDTGLSRWTLIGGGGGGGGATPVPASGTFTPALNTLSEVDISTTNGVATFPTGTTAAVIGFTDKLGVGSTTKYLDVKTNGTDIVQGYAAADVLRFNYPNFTAWFYRLAGSTTWYWMRQLASTTPPATQTSYGSVRGAEVPASTGASAIGSTFIGNEIIPAASTYSVSLTSAGAPFNLKTLPLDPGDYDIEGFGAFALNGAVAGSTPYTTLALSTGSASLAVADTLEGIAQDGNFPTTAYGVYKFVKRRLRITATTTVYLVARAGFSSGSPTVSDSAGFSIRATKR